MAYTLPSSSRTDLINLDKYFGTCPIGRSAMSSSCNWRFLSVNIEWTSEGKSSRGGTQTRHVLLSCVFEYTLSTMSFVGGSKKGPDVVYMKAFDDSIFYCQTLFFQTQQQTTSSHTVHHGIHLYLTEEIRIKTIKTIIEYCASFSTRLPHLDYNNLVIIYYTCILLYR